MMWKKGKLLAAYICAIAWWSIFYPELCFTEGTCEAVQTAEAQETDSRIATAQNKDAVMREGKTGDAGQDVSSQSGQTDTVTGILQAGDGEVVIRSRFLEWCEEVLPGKK